MSVSGNIVAGSTRNFILQNALLDGAPDWPSDAVVTLFMQQIITPVPPVISFTATVTVNNNTTGLTANYVTEPAGDGDPGDLAPPGKWQLWWEVSSPSNSRFKAVFDPIPFTITPGPLSPLP